MYPAAVLLFSFFLFHDPPKWKEILSLALCISGVYLLSVSGSERIVLLGVATALISGAFYALYIIVMGKSAASTMDPFVLTFYIHLFNGLFSGAVSVFSGTLNGLTILGWGVISICAVSSGVVTIALQAGIHRIGAKSASVLCVVEPLVSVFIGVFVMKEKFSIRSGVGTVLVIAAAIIAGLYGRSQAEEQRT